VSEGKETEPVRVKVYGLFALTRRRYLRQAATGLLSLGFLLVAWWLSWPSLRQPLDKLELPPTMSWIVAVLNRVPWILLGAGLYKCIEMWLVLRAYARREAAAAVEPKSQTTSSSSP
jgi:hypothetical protein